MSAQFKELAALFGDGAEAARAVAEPVDEPDLLELQPPNGVCPFAAHRPDLAEPAPAFRMGPIAAPLIANPPLPQRLAYHFLCRFIHHPKALRFAAALLRTWPQLKLGAARVDAVRQILTSPLRFSNACHVKNLVAGEFLIGMEPGPRYAAEKALFDNVLGRLSHVRADADREAQVRARRLVEAGPAARLDLIEDYLFWVVYRAIEPAFGSAAASAVAAGPEAGLADDAIVRRHLVEARHVAAQLFSGRSAPLWMQRRAALSASSMRTRTAAVEPVIARAWRGFAPNAPPDQIVRNAIGLEWIPHAITVQAGALVVQELLARPAIYRELRGRASQIGCDMWGHDGDRFRADLADHVRELMRFRPPFPLLARYVPRNTEYESGAKRNPVCPAGSSVQAWTIGAQFDPVATDDPASYKPGREWKSGPGLRDMMFGFGSRQCPAKDQAVEILTSALLGLLTLPEKLQWAGSRRQRMVYEGPMVTHLYVRQTDRGA